MNEDIRRQLRSLDYTNRIQGKSTNLDVYRDVRKKVAEHNEQLHGDAAKWAAVRSVAEENSCITVKDAMNKYGLKLKEISEWFPDVEGVFNYNYQLKDGSVNDITFAEGQSKGGIYQDDLLMESDIKIYLDAKKRGIV